jgi:LCP family protein required for cell wall assembly
VAFFDDAFADDPIYPPPFDDTAEAPTARIPVLRPRPAPSADAVRSRPRHAHPQPSADPADRPRARHARPVSSATTAERASDQRPGERSDRRRRRGRSTIWRATTTAVAFTVLLVLGAAGLTGYVYEKYNHQITRVAVLSTHDPAIREAARQQNAENFLIIGSDTRAGADAKYGNVAGARSDTTILVHLSPDRSKATVISIPRDSWVDIPQCASSHGVLAAHKDMFNSAFSSGGPACTIATVQRLTGIAVTHFIEIDFSGFESMVNAMGSVTICSPQKVYDPGSGLRLKVGDNRLNGTQALSYVRARETLGDGSDLGRIKRQQLFLGAVLRQAMNGSMLTNPTRLTSFLNAATKAITVDKGTTFADLRTLATSMQGLNPKRVTFYTAPIADQNYTPPGTNMTGRVLLDDVKGRVLYDSVIHDTKPVWVTGSGKAAKVRPAKTTPATTATGAKATPTPTAGMNAAQKSCSL